VQTFAETNANLKDGRAKGVLAGFSWKFSESLSLGRGFGWFSELGGGSIAFTILVIDWKITEKWRLPTGRGLAAANTARPRLICLSGPHFSGFVQSIKPHRRIRWQNPPMADESTFKLFFILFAGAIGFGYFRYGRQQQNLVASFCGAGLMGYPYFVHGIVWLVLLGLLLLAVPFFIRN